MRVHAIALCACVCGCAESPLASPSFASTPSIVPPPMQQSAAFLPPVDTFWLQQAIAERNRPPPEPVHSISLGYVGDTPLSGGVMRDTPIASPQDYIQYTHSAPLRDP